MKDLIIIGAGPGGYELALEASKKGLKVTLIEQDQLGGTCLNYGCIPTKSYYQNAKILKELEKKEIFGITGKLDFDFSVAYKRKEEIISSLKEGIKFLLDKTDIEYINGRGRLINSNTVKVGEETYIAENIVIATGSRPIRLDLPGFSLEGVLTSRDLLELKDIPQKMVIIGGGVIGIEMASIFHKFGCDVEVIEMCDAVLPNYDQEISKRLQGYLKQQGIKIHMRSKVVKIDKKENLIVNFIEKDSENLIVCDKVLLAIGRKPNIDNLGLEDVGINYTGKGITVDDNFMTNIPHIYAIGDVNGKTMLAHAATYSGYKVLSNILNEPDEIDLENIPSCVFTFPEIASIGLTEEEARKTGLEVKIGKSMYRACGKAVAMNEVEGFVKLIAIDNVIMGAHIIGYDASVIIHEALPLINEKITVSRASGYVHAHPTLSEVFSGALKELKK
ncbi:MAG: dihydrolipoyl dehydrogenase [Bacilli bacterium]|nr:dihydrolipoyl dehydrogenase [Bacilli bacterium]